MVDELLAAAGRLRQTLHKPAADATIPKDILDLVPQDFYAEQAIELIKSKSGSDSDIVTDALWATYVLIQAREEALHGQNSAGDDGSDDLATLAETIGEHLLPIASHARDQDSKLAKSLADRSDICLSILSLLAFDYNVRLSPKVLLAATAYTSLHDYWTIPESKVLAEKILASHFSFSLPPSSSDGDKEPRRLVASPRKDTPTALNNNNNETLESFITGTILNSFLRPLFSHSRPATVTASGRKAEFVEPRRYMASTDDAEAEARKPWKYAQRHSITAFAWAVRNADQHILKSHWHRYTPILLTLLDESPAQDQSSLNLKVRALGLARDFWTACPPGLLASTGLARVLEDAVFPSVLMLPSLTPEDEAVTLLGAAYPTLRAMAGLSAEDDDGHEGKKQEGLGLRKGVESITDEQERMCDRLVRDGVMVGYHHAKEHVLLVELLCAELRRMVLGMGLLTVKYLKDIFPVIFEIMTDPFGTQHLPTLHAATRLLQAVLSTCWPRIATPDSGYGNDILRALMLCWLNVDDHFNDGSEEEENAKQLRADLVKAADMLAAVLDTAAAEADEDGLWEDRVQPLIEAEPRLKGLLAGATVVSVAATG